MSKNTRTVQPQPRATLTTLTKWQRIAMPLVLAACMASCGLKAGMEDCQRARDTIKAELGVAATCAFKSSTGTAGRKVVVTIHLEATPPGDVAAVKTKVVDVVKRSFRTTVDEVNISF